RVVVKALRTDGLARDVAEVFREARALEELNHPVIVRLRYCDYAGANATRPFLVMDYFEGITLEEHVRQQGPLSPPDALDLAGELAEGLHAAHLRGILHRDVKPANVLVRRDRTTQRWQVKVIDFGLALRSGALQQTVSNSGPLERTLLGSSVAGTLE